MGRHPTLIFCPFFGYLNVWQAHHGGADAGGRANFSPGGRFSLVQQTEGSMALVERIKGICLKPATEWAVIEAEPATTGQLIAGYAAPLAAITPIASLIGGVVIGRTIPFIGTYHVPIVTGVVTAVV